MLNPYWMAAVNFLGCAFVLGSVLFYKYIYPKKPVNLFYLLLVVSALLCLSLLRKGDYESGDFNIHIYRIMSFYDSLKEGILMPSWAAELNASYGNPLFILNYPLPYYLVSFFHVAGFSFISSMKMFFGLSIYLSGIFMYLWIKELTKNKLAAFASAIFYLFNPYHLIDVHLRATLGETTVFFISPLILYFITLFFKRKELKFLILSGLSTFLLFLAHPLVGFPILGIIFLFIVLSSIQVRSIKRFGESVFFLILGVLASAYSWLSFKIYAPYIFNLTSTASDLKPSSFQPFLELFYSPWRYGLLFQGNKGELATFIGYSQELVVVLSIILLLTNKVPSKLKTQYVFWVLMFVFFLLLLTPFSIPLWKFFPMFRMLIPTGRLFVPVALCTSAIVAYFTLSFSGTAFKKMFVYVLLCLTILSTILNWGHRRVIPAIDDSVLRMGVWKSTIVEGKTAYFLNSRWADTNNFWFTELPKNHLEILQGKASVKELLRTSISHTYIVDSKSPIVLRENTMYYPGWYLTSNSERVNIYPDMRGRINAKLPQGLMYLELNYKDIPAYDLVKKADIIIVLTLLILLLFQFTPRRVE